MDIKQLKEKTLTATVKLDDDVEIDLRHITPAEMSSLRKQATRKVQKGYRTEENLDEDRFRTLVVNAAVGGWRGIENDGEPFECTEDNRVFLMDNWIDFRLLVLDVSPDFKRMQEYAGKNS